MGKHYSHSAKKRQEYKKAMAKKWAIEGAFKHFLQANENLKSKLQNHIFNNGGNTMNQLDNIQGSVVVLKALITKQVQEIGHLQKINDKTSEEQTKLADLKACKYHAPKIYYTNKAEGAEGAEGAEAEVNTNCKYIKSYLVDGISSLNAEDITFKSAGYGILHTQDNDGKKVKINSSLLVLLQNNEGAFDEMLSDFVLSIKAIDLAKLSLHNEDKVIFQRIVKNDNLQDVRVSDLKEHCEAHYNQNEEMPSAADIFCEEQYIKDIYEIYDSFGAYPAA